MDIVIKLDLERYRQHEIIEALKIGAISHQEVIDANVAHKFFSDDLQDILNSRTSEQKTTVL